jgi:hypothetical protein
MTMTQDLSINFEAASSDSFRFLEESYGFSRSVLRPNKNSILIRYESHSIYVNVMYGPPAYEPEMSFGRRGIDDVTGGYSFEAGDLIQLWEYRNLQLKQVSPGIIEGQVAWLASLLEKYGKECLMGNSATYSEMKARRERLISEWRRQEQYNELSQSIDSAWKAKDYKRIVTLCSRYSGSLGDLDRKRLQYAQSHA